MSTDRRTVLAGLVGLAVVVAGCGSSSRARTAPSPVATDPDSPALAAAAADEARLVAGYDRAVAGASAHERPHLEVARALHATHLAALRSAGARTTGTPAAVSGTLRALELASGRRRQTAAEVAHAGSRAALLAGIAASHLAARP